MPHTDSQDFSVCPLVEAEDRDPAPSPPVPRGRTLAAAALTFLGVAGGLAWVGAQHDANPQFSSSSVVGLAEKQTDTKTEACSGEGEACLDSKCCAPGGENGMQCFAKNDNWASCAPACEPGVHEPEKEGEWGPDGVFKKVEWSCKKLGELSEPGCEHYNATAGKCPESRCMVKGDSCLPVCGGFKVQDGCWNSKHCMWQDDTCMDACWEHGSHDKCEPTSKCYWTGEKCQMGWWLFNDLNSCPNELGYMWNGTCNLDPCSAPGEDCTKSSCCSTERGGSGMTCFAKSKYYATCKETCDPGVGKDWTCDKLGERARISAGCAWAGKSCELDKLCCNRGFVCAKKDENFIGCVQTKKQTTWVTQNIPIPSDWDGTVLGAGRDEYQYGQAGPDDEKLGSSLYCFLAYLPESYEEALVDKARTNKASIFGCEKWDTFHTWKSANGAWDTGEATLTNTDVFINVWQQMGEKGEYLNHDWVVKVDPDCVMVPDRLRSHLDALNMPKWATVYVKNNGMDPGLGNNGFLGAIEVFSQKAVTLYLDNADGCQEALGLNAGEDGYFKGCMDALGVGYAPDTEMFFPDHAAGACMMAARAAFHPLKDPAEWQHCWDIVLGKVPF